MSKLKPLPLPDRLRIKAGMIEMCETIPFGSDALLMREAADELERIEKVYATTNKSWRELKEENERLKNIITAQSTRGA